MDYQGEHLLPGYFGHFFVILSLIASLVSLLAYGWATISKNIEQREDWRKLGRAAFITQSISIAIIFGLVFYIIYAHLFEYKYAWTHTSLSLEFKYLLSSFWEGVEGSFLLWALWGSVLGLFLLRKADSWESPVMAIMAIGQFCLATMIAGIYFFGWRLGSSPFVLLRDEMPAPIFQRPDYMNFIKDGNDLNPLLQNYWMVIHPPVLFLGFASTIVPFAFAVAGLWTKRGGEWIKPALPWALFSAGILGLGIMMGGAWAYESLNFGGYWAWDPVENASMVPWLVLVAGIHTMLIYKHSGYSLRSSHSLPILAFFLVIYSSFLTKSGILGDTSVHSFVDVGLNVQLFLMLFVLAWLPAIFAAATRQMKIVFASIAALSLLLLNWFPVVSFFSILAAIIATQVAIHQQIPADQKEESASSREFWMFIGSLVFLLAAGYIIVATSLPVFNKLFGSNVTVGEEVEFSYNRVIIFVAILIGVLTATVQYLKYKETKAKFFRSRILWPTVAAVLIATLVLVFGDIHYDKFGWGFLGAIWLAMVTSIYAVIANLAYIWVGVNGKLKKAGGSIAHFGFGLMLVGILISASKKEVISHNVAGVPARLAEGENPAENITLFSQMPVTMGDYQVTFDSASKHPKKELWYYHLQFRNKNNPSDSFELKPNAFVNYKENNALIANPDAKHYWDHDIFTYITSIADPKATEDTASFKEKVLAVGDTAFYANGYYILEDLNVVDNIPVAGFGKDDKATVATINVYSKNNTLHTVKPILINAKGNEYANPDSVLAESIVFRLDAVDNNTAKLGVKESSNILEYVTFKAYKFPYINLLWLGTIIMVIGFMMSAIQRWRVLKKNIPSSFLS